MFLDLVPSLKFQVKKNSTIIKIDPWVMCLFFLIFHVCGRIDDEQN